MAEFTFHDTPLRKGDWIDSTPYFEHPGFPSDVVQADFTAASQAVGYNYLNFASTGNPLRGAAHFASTRWAPPPEATPNRPDVADYVIDYQGPDVTAADINSALALTAADTFAAGRSMGEYTGYDNAGQPPLYQCAIVGTHGSFSFPFGNGYPRQLALSSRVGHNYWEMRPEIKWPFLNYRADKPASNGALDGEWESDNIAVELLMEWNFPVFIRGSASNDFTTSGTVKFRMATPSEAAVIPANTYGALPNAPTAPFSEVLGELTYSFSSVGGAVDQTIFFTGSRTFTDAQVKAYANARMVFEFSQESASTVATGEGWSSNPGEWGEHQNLNIAVTTPGSWGTFSGGFPTAANDQFFRGTYTLRPPRHRYLFDLPDVGDGAPKTVHDDNAPSVIYGILGGYGDYGRIFKWSATGGLVLVNPAQWGRFTGPLTRLADGRIFVLDAGANFFDDGETPPLGYTLDENLGDYQSVTPAYPLWYYPSVDHRVRWRGAADNGALLYRPENNSLIYSSEIDHLVTPSSPPQYQTYVGGVEFDYTWHEFALDGTDTLHNADRQRLDSRNITLDDAVWVDGWFYRVDSSQVDRWNPETGEFEWLWMSDYVNKMMAGAWGTKIMWLAYDYNTRTQTLRMLDTAVATFHPATRYYDGATYPPREPDSSFSTVPFDDNRNHDPHVPYYNYESMDNFVRGDVLYYWTGGHPDRNYDESLPGNGLSGYALIAYDLVTLTWSTVFQLNNLLEPPTETDRYGFGADSAFHLAPVAIPLVLPAISGDFVLEGRYFS